MPKMMLPATQTSCLKDSNTNFQVNVEIGITYFLGRLQLVSKNQRRKYQIYLFKIWSYIFLFVRRNQCAILFAATHVHMPKMMLPATHTSCLNDTHTNFLINVGIGIAYFLGIFQFVCKNQRWKYQIYLFKIWSYKFLFLHRNW